MTQWTRDVCVSPTQRCTNVIQYNVYPTLSKRHWRLDNVGQMLLKRLVFTRVCTGNNHVTCLQLSKPAVTTLSYRRSHNWWQKAQIKACAILAIVKFVASNKIMHWHRLYCKETPNNCRAYHLNHCINTPTEISKIMIKIRNAYVW